MYSQIASGTLASARFKRFFAAIERYDLIGKILVVPHPVRLGCDSQVQPVGSRKRQIVAVGRWDSYAKNTALLVRTLEIVLSASPEVSAIIAGSGSDAVIKALRRVPESIARRIQVEGFMNHDKLLELYGMSQVFLLSSRSESFNIAAAEALCMGCSIAAPPQIPTASWFCGGGSGSIATNYKAWDLADAALVEIANWEDGRRIPEEIAHQWRSAVGIEGCARGLAGIGRLLEK